MRTIFSGESFGSTPAAAAMSGDLTPPEDDDPGALLDGDMGGVRKPSFADADPALLAVPGTLTRPIPGNPLNTSSSSSSSSSSSAAAAPFSLM